MSTEEIGQKICYVEFASMADLARMACSYRQYPRRVESFDLNGTRVASIVTIFPNTLLIMYSPLAKHDQDGKYISYKIDSMKKESYSITDTATNRSTNAPIIHYKSNIIQLTVARTKYEIPEAFDPIELKDLGSLARLSYDGANPEDPELTLYVIPINDNSWAIGYWLTYSMDKPHYEFYYIKLDVEPIMPFLRYKEDTQQEPEFTDKVEHGYVYMPVVKFKESHPMFGFI